MFTLLSGLWKYLFQKDEYFILILGLDNAGKTTLLEQIKQKFCKTYSGIPFEKITTTVGLNIGKITISHVKLMFWDLGGQQELRILWDKYFEECHGVIYVVDSANDQRLDESHNAFEESLAKDALQGVPLLVLANKQDAHTCLAFEKIESIFRQGLLAGRKDYFIQPTSALNGDGIESGINWLVEHVKQNTIERPPHQKDIS